MSLSKKVMILFRPDQLKRMKEEARRRGIPVAELVRQAVDRVLAEGGRAEKNARLAAARRLVAAEEPVMEWDELERVLEKGQRG